MELECESFTACSSIYSLTQLPTKEKNITLNGFALTGMFAKPAISVEFVRENLKMLKILKY